MPVMSQLAEEEVRLNGLQSPAGGFGDEVMPWAYLLKQVIIMSLM